MKQSLRCQLVASATAALVLLLSPTSAQATPQTLLRGLGNVALAPLDAALAPVTTFIGLRQNLRDIDDSPGVRLFYPVPAFFYAVGLQLACASIRSMSGGMEVAVGVLVLPFDTDLDPLFDPVDDADALVEIDIEYMEYPLRFGVNYTISGG